MAVMKNFKIQEVDPDELHKLNIEVSHKYLKKNNVKAIF